MNPDVGDVQLKWGTARRCI